MKIPRKLIWINLLSLIIFIFILLEVLFRGFLIRWDLAINYLMKSQYVCIVNFSKAVGVIFDVRVLLIISFLIAIYLWFKDSKKDSVFFVVVGLAGAGIIYLLKELIIRARPLSDLIIETGFSFPSGHTTIAVLFFGLLTYLIFKKNKSKNIKLISSVIFILISLIIGFTRLYLGVHWFSDVVGGFSLGVFLLSFGILIKEKFFKPKYL